MNNLNKKWLHGTKIHFNDWMIPPPDPKHKPNMKAHSALFFTTDVAFALGAAEEAEGLLSTTVSEQARVLDMTNCSEEESENYRLKALETQVISRNEQVETAEKWRKAWSSGSIMKFFPKEIENEYWAQQYALAKSGNTIEAANAHNNIHQLTRNNIEGLVEAARELGYDCVIGNEIDTLHTHGSQTYPIMFAINKDALNDISWESIPKKKQYVPQPTNNSSQKLKNKRKLQKKSKRNNRKK